ncbi:MAG TPA: FAD-binding oxidoreductase [Casimicrobiaceae bacterium]|nr:FAD-binding oxidoreductase [Casimicrobiaceae bacterium]
MRETDVAVLGAGIYGCSTAYFLARTGVRVLVIDADDIGAGASAANAGNLHLQLSPFSHATKDDAWVTEFARTLPFFIEALALWKRLASELPGNIELRCPGGIMVAETDRQMQLLQEKVALERSQGLNVRMIDSGELHRRAPYIARHVLGASLCPDEGMANALAAVAALADGARNAGASFMLNARVERIDESGSGWRVDTIAGPVRCDRVVIAAGSSSGVIAGTAGIALPLEHRVIQMIATEPCAPFVEHLVYHTEERLTLKQVANGNVLIGGGWEAARDSVFGRPAVLQNSLRGSLALARRIVPLLGEVSVIRTWAGPNIYTPDGRPILGAVPGRPGLFVSICNTYGFTLGPQCGGLVAAAMTGLASAREVAEIESMGSGRFSTTAP